MTEHVFKALFPFGGLGLGARGFLDAFVKLLGRTGRFECLGGIDFDAGACADFEYLTGTPSWCTDVLAITAQDLVERYGAMAPDVVFMSPPCLPANGLVLTPTGPRRIDSLRANDLVLTHTGYHRHILKIGSHLYTGAMHGFRLNGTVDIQEFTSEHPLWIRRGERRVVGGRKLRGEPRFVAAEDVRVGDRVGFPIDPEIAGTARRFIASLGDPTRGTKGGKSSGPYAKPLHAAKIGRVRDLRGFADSHAMWFLIGAYLGDGYRRTTRHEVVFCVGPSGGALDVRVRAALAAIGIDGVNEDDHGGRGNVKLRVHAKHLSMICGAFGDGAAEKRIPHELMSLERPFLDALIDGYRATDGSERAASTKNGKRSPASWKIVSISLQLLRDVQRLLLRRGEFGAIHCAWPGGPQTIMGREVQTRPRWEVKVTQAGRRGTYDFDTGTVWARVRKKTTRQTTERVWNVEVDVDNTFCAPMMATHNCKGSSRLLSAEKAKTEKYQAMNRLAVEWTRRMLEAWPDPPALVLLENVPGLPTRAAGMLRELRRLLKAAGYVFHTGTHDCGEIGGLAQHRTRFLLVARHPKKCPPLLYQPPKRRVRGVGEVLSELPMPATVAATAWGELHTMPRLSWRNWLRLALIPAGGDWRDLAGVLEGRARREVFRRHAIAEWSRPIDAVTGPGGHSVEAVGDPRVTMNERPGNWSTYGVNDWTEPSGTIAGESKPSNGAYSVADPRVDFKPSDTRHNNNPVVRPWGEPVRTIVGRVQPDSVGQSVADPRLAQLVLGDSPSRHWNKLDVRKWDDPALTVIGKEGPANGGASVADPRLTLGCEPRSGAYGVTPFDAPSPTITGSASIDNRPVSVADPRGVQLDKPGYDAAYGVLGWDDPARTVAGNSAAGCGAYAVADPRERGFLDGVRFLTLDEAMALEIDAAKPPPFTPVILAEDGTWHRPLTKLELGALQGMPTHWRGAPLRLTGTGTQIAEHIGNAVPRAAAEAIAGRMLVALVEAAAGAFSMQSGNVWVRPDPMEART